MKNLPDYTYRVNPHPKVGFSFSPADEETFLKVLSIVEKFGQESFEGKDALKNREDYLKLSQDSLSKLKLMNGSLSLFDELRSLYYNFMNPSADYAPLEITKKGILTKGKMVLAQTTSDSSHKTQTRQSYAETPLFDSEVESILEVHNADKIVITPDYFDLCVDVYEK